MHHFVVVMSHTTHPGNIGAAARAMKSMGLSELRLVQTVSHQDPVAYHRSSGAEDLLYNAQCYDSLASALSDCHYAIATSGRHRASSNPQCICARKLPSHLSTLASPSRIALVFGNEQNGLDNQDIQQCHLQVAVPTNPDFKSLNVAACVQLICFLCSEYHTSDIKNSTENRATHEQINALVNTLSQHVFEHETDKSLHDINKLRQLSYRYQLSSDEVDFIHGVIRRLVKQIN